MNPLGWMRSIKLKLGVVILAAIAATLIGQYTANHSGLARTWGYLAAIVLALIVVQLLARGMTSPLRAMVRAAGAVARGDHEQTVPVRGRDEVAALAVAFNSMSRELAETDRLRRELVANVSHELRTPIAAVQASLENVMDGVEPADPATLAAMHAQLERLGTMVEQLLDLSRMEADETPLEIEEFPAQRLLERAQSEAALREDVSVDLSVEPAALRIDGDEDRLHQVVSNLLENALRVTPEGGRVHLRARATATGARLEVVDSGPGIPADERDHVFERFYRLDPSRSNGGAGLGLAIAQWITGMHGGEISIEDANPRGCRMVVELPGREGRGGAHA